MKQYRHRRALGTLAQAEVGEADYQRMVQSAQRLGAGITSDQTARELEKAISMMLLIKGSSLRKLTDLFEEARYSLHPITETEAEQAQECLLRIAEEMNITLSV